jgi:hypothetical protein
MIKKLIISLLVIGGMHSSKAETFEPYVKDNQYVTPHIKWAKPLSGGAIKTLVIAPINGERDAWELAQRMSLDFDLFQITMSGRSTFGDYGGSFWTRLFYDEQQQKLDKILNENQYDLFILANVSLNCIPPEQLYKILKQITEGKGLVLANQNLGSPLLDKLMKKDLVGDGMELFQPIPYSGFVSGIKLGKIPKDFSPVKTIDETIPYELKGKLKCYQVKKGRYVHLAYPFKSASWGAFAARPSLIPGFPVNIKNIRHSDYYYALTSKACLWATKRIAPVKIVSISTDKPEIDAGTKTKIIVKLKSQINKNFQGKLLTEIRDAVSGFVLWKEQGKIKLRDSEHQIKIAPEINLSSDVFINCRLLNTKGEVADFGSNYLKVKQILPTSISLDKETVNRGEDISGSIETDKKADKIELSYFDSRGRIWEKQTLKPTDGKVTFSLPTSKTRIIIHELQATAFSKGIPVSNCYRAFTVRYPRESYYVDVSDEHWSTYHSIRRYERAYEWGASGLRAHNPRYQDAVASAMAGLDFNPGRPHVPGAKALDPEWVKGLEQIGKSNSEIYKHLNQKIYNTTDDCGPRTGFVPSCFGEFITWLKATYNNDISSLNLEWGTKFKDFSEIKLDFVKGSLKKNRVATWSDYIAYTGDTYINTQLKYRKALRSEDPSVASGCDAVYAGCSLASLYRNLNYIMPYYRSVGVEMARSLNKAPQPVYSGICMGTYGYYSVSETQRRFMPWQILLSGNNSILFWSLLCGFENDLVMDHKQLIGWSMDEISKLKFSGIAKLINNSKRLDNGIAILYSEASQRAEVCGSKFNKVDPSSLAFQEVIEDQGLQYNYVSSDSIIKDKVLEDGKIKLLILAHTQAVSKAEAEAIKNFVKNGGTVWADVEPGIRNGHGRYMQGQGMLGELFGITRTTAPGKAESEKVKLPLTNHEMSLIIDPSVKLNGATAGISINNTPLLISNNYGNGQALLFNFDTQFYGISGRGEVEAGQTVRELSPALTFKPLIKSLLSKAKINTPDLSLNDNPSAGIELIRYRHNSKEFIGVMVKQLKGQKFPVKISLKLDAKYHIHDMKNKKDYGNADSININNANAYDVYLFALNSENESKISLKAPSQINLGQTLSASVENSSKDGVLKFSLIDPDGIILRDYLQTSTTKSCNIPLPYNAKAGNWILEAYDPVSGKKAQQSIAVKGENK